MPLHTADALVLRTYKLGEADRIVVFMTADRGKKRGVAEHARRPRSRFRGALEPLTEVRVAYFERERRDLVGLNYAETVVSPLAASSPEALGHSHYFAELIDEWAAEETRTSGCSGSGRRRSRRWSPAWTWTRWPATSRAGCCGCRGCIRRTWRSPRRRRASSPRRDGSRRPRPGRWGPRRARCRRRGACTGG
ncbi:MAG: DNA repair protein RecO [Vicinamibacterales bacterium]